MEFNVIQCNSMESNGIQCNPMQFNTFHCFSTLAGPRCNSMFSKVCQCFPIIKNLWSNKNSMQFNAVWCFLILFNAASPRLCLVPLHFNASQSNSMRCKAFRCSSKIMQWWFIAKSRMIPWWFNPKSVTIQWWINDTYDDVLFVVWSPSPETRIEAHYPGVTPTRRCSQACVHFFPGFVRDM